MKIEIELNSEQMNRVMDAVKIWGVGYDDRLKALQRRVRKLEAAK